LPVINVFCFYAIYVAALPLFYISTIKIM